MFKTGLKTFAYSFVFSLSAIIAVNKAVSHDIPSDDDIKIPHNNISLFLKENSTEKGLSAVKKIALIKPKEDTVSANLTMKIASVPLEKMPEVIDDKPLSSTKPVKVIMPENKSGGKLHKTAQPQAKVKLAQAPKVKVLPKVEAIKIPPKVEATKKIEPLPAETKIAAAEVEREVPKAKETLLIPLQKINSAARSEKIAINSKAAESQVAMLNLEKPIKSVVAETENKKNESSEGANNKAEISGWQSMAEKKGEPIAERAPNDVYKVTQVDIIDTPQNENANTESKLNDGNSSEANSEQNAVDDNKWIAAKGTKFPVNQNVLEQDYYKQAQDTEKVSAVLSGEPLPKDKGTKVAGEIVQNILIPIPDDIINNKDLKPKLASDPINQPLEEEVSRREAALEEDEGSDIPFFVEGEEDKNSSEVKEAGGILNSISSLFSTTEKTQIADSGDKNIKSSEKKSENKIKKNKILPTEIRLSFQPNRAEISGNTLNWIQAFALKTKESDYNVLEVRIDGTSSFELQQKRLNLLYNILTNLGLEYRKVDPVFTSREPNSFILRVVNRGDNKEDIMGPVRAMYYRKW